MVKEMRKGLDDTFNINVSHLKCKRAKRMILESLDGSFFFYEYNKLEAYANELRLSNPGSDVVINISNDAVEEGKIRFSRMYVCFDALKKGFKSGLRPFIGLDGTFLKGKVKGQLLVAAALDTTRHFYPIAWAIVDKETKVTWSWFLTLLEKSLDLKKGEGITFMSDMQKRLIGARDEVFGELKNHLWWCSWCTYKEEVQDHLSMMGKENKEAGEDLLNRYPAESWCRAYFDSVCKNWQVENNLVESFNNWVMNARFKPIIKMLEEKELRDDAYEVSHSVDRHRVNIELKRCICRTWDLTGIPCPHAIRSLLYRKINPLTHIHCGKAAPINNAFTAEPNFDFPSSDEADPPLMLMSILKAKTRFLRQMHIGEATGTRCIGFIGDASGISKPTNLPF
ncbi:uncharacterized protein LOC132062331 [Lycium ferocissimum]|uniref:uncharacterized protein LOC132062331 n=1 Tax=Lycium ferocissimum TaxID=112874 RepID=UPI002815FEF0|nr:uncharacterized protein LOC132062331 [Lycium ferocissimum]